jgi:hypothetical protein
MIVKPGSKRPRDEVVERPPGRAECCLLAFAQSASNQSAEAHIRAKTDGCLKS